MSKHFDNFLNLFRTKKRDTSYPSFVVSPGFEPRQTEPKTVVLPLYYETNIV